MNNNICIFITSEFPYGYGEKFIETEISFLSNSFDKVLIFSLFAKKNENRTRNINMNVESYPLNISIGKSKYLKYIIKGIFSKKRIATKTDEDANSLKKRIICLYGKGRSEASFQNIKDYLKIIDLKDSKIIIYSYWFNDHALTAIDLAEYLQRKGKSVKVISRAHGYDLYAYRNSLNFIPFRTNQFQNIDMVYPCSTDGVKYLKQKYPAFKNKIKLALLGTIDRGFSHVASVDSFNIVTCSNIIALKRLDLFEQALEIVYSHNNNFRWFCIGSGPLLTSLKRTVFKSDIANLVTFLGSISNKEVLDFYKYNQIHLFCNVSETEGLPVSIMEALSFGIPCIATDVGGTSDLIDDKVGKLIKSEITAEELANEILLIMNLQKHLYLKMRNSARKRWEENSDARINYQKWCKEILNL